MKSFFYLLLLILCSASCQSQSDRPRNQIVGGPCEGCEAIYEYGDQVLLPVDTLPNFLSTSPQLKITGTVYKQDGRSPAENTILYIYHTNRAGIYESKGNEKGWARRHGFIRGWVKTGKDGHYTFYTFRPVAYPGNREAEHIHITVKEPNCNEYYIDEYQFEDDPLLTKEKRKTLNNRGGSGIVNPKMENGILTIRRDITLGLNIPNY